MKTKILIIALLLSMADAGNLFAQQPETKDSEDFYDMSLEELMNVKVSVASIKALTARESPGIVTLVTDDEIRSSGARDLMEILNTIPGFSFGVDVEGVVGLGVRGNWAHEGKFLLLIDGQEMNENLFSSTQFGNHYPVENIKQIEIIRGPGSAMYGGYAEYAVINIITRSGGEINGVSADGSVSATARGLTGSQGALSIGKSFRDFSIGFSAFGGMAKRSDNRYTDTEGNSFDMFSNSAIKNYYTNTSVDFRKFHLRLITDQYLYQTRDYYIAALSKAYEEKFTSCFIELKKELNLSKKIIIYPKVSYKKQLPWNFTGEPANGERDQYNIVSEKMKVSLSAQYDPSEKISFSAGGDWAAIKAKDLLENSFFSNNEKTFHNYNHAVFVQTLLRLGFADFTLGARYNGNNRFNSSFVPRIGITRVFRKFHFKCLYSSAFRTPSLENINYGQDIQPERTSVFELEGGIQMSGKTMLTLNAYSIRTSNTIVYYYDAFNDEDVYKNYYGSGTQGLELVYRVKDKWGWLEFNYAWYNAQNNLRLENYQVPGNENILLGFAAHKFNVKGNLKLNNHWNIGSSCSFSSPKYGCTGEDADGTLRFRKYPSSFLANVFVRYENLLIKGLHAGMGINNIGNAPGYYIQPYNSQHAPLPGMSREYTIKISYAFNFSK